MVGPQIQPLEFNALILKASPEEWAEIDAWADRVKGRITIDKAREYWGTDDYAT